MSLLLLSSRLVCCGCTSRYWTNIKEVITLDVWTSRQCIYRVPVVILGAHYLLDLSFLKLCNLVLILDEVDPVNHHQSNRLVEAKK